MQKYKTFIIFLFLVAIWSLFFSTIKFFLWWDLKDWIWLDLQTISGYLSFWWIFAYLVGWALAYTFLKKYFLFFISIWALVFAVIWYINWFDTEYFIAFIISLIWLFYGLWTVVKNIIISIEIQKTGLPDTTVNAIAGIVFVVFIIIWSIFWSLLFERLWHEWYLLIIFLLGLSSVFSLFLDYDNINFKSLLKRWWKSYLLDRKHKIRESMKEYIPEISFVIKKYGVIMLVISLLWAISTIISQKAIEYSALKFDKLNSESAILLLYSALWAIIGNILSTRMQGFRWRYFLVFNIFFGIFIMLFPFLAISFQIISILAFLAGIFFWIVSNLIEAYFFHKIWDENKKEYWSSTYWLVLSIVIFIMMFLSSYVDSILGFTWLMIILWIFILFSSLLIYLAPKD